jgi:tetratricopeptide (TPR) repeat protein
VAPSADDHDCQPPPGPPAAGGPAGSAAPRPDEAPAPAADDTVSRPADPEATQYHPAPTPADLDETRYPAAAPDPDATNYPMAAGSAERALPRRFGDYQLLEVVGRGGMGVVFRAQQVKANRLVALKMILAGRFAAPETLERFRLEARAAAALNHPGIVQIYDVDEAEGRPFFTMEFVTGGSLQDALANGPLPPEQAARLLRHVAEAVQYAHEHGIIHRDLKPQNILLQQGPGDPAPKLTDFGLARAAAEGSGLTKTGEAMGTPSFMPPEQAAGNLREIGPHSDVYSLGAVLYCTLTGKPPFESSEAHETMRRVREEEPVSPRRRNPRVPRDLETICLKCLAKEPRQRYASAAQLVEDLDCFLADLPLRHARRVGPLARALKRLDRAVRRQPMRAAYVALSMAAFLVLGVLVLKYFYDRRAGFERTRAEARQLEDAARTAQGEGQRSVALDDYGGARDRYIRLLGGYPDLSDLRMQLADVYTQRGILLRNLRDWKAAEDEFHLAREQLEPLEAAHPQDASCRLRLAEVFHNLGILYDARETTDFLRQALGFYQQSLDIRKKLCETAEGNRDYRRDLARSYGYIGDTQLALGLNDEAWASYEEARKLRQALVEEDDNDIPAKYQLARSKGNTGNFFDWTGEPGKALDAYVDCKSFIEGFPPHQVPAEFRADLAYCRATVARLQLDRDERPQEGTGRLLEQALQFFEPTPAANPKDKQDKSTMSAVAEIHVSLGKYRLRTDDAAGAETELREALTLLDKHLVVEPPVLPDDEYQLALTYALLSQLPQQAAERPVNEGFALRELEKAHDLGYRNVGRLEHDAGFRTLRDQAHFRDIVEGMKKERAAGMQKDGG